MQVVDYQAILKIAEKRHISHVSSEEQVGEFRASFERDKHENFWKLEGEEWKVESVECRVCYRYCELSINIVCCYAASERN